MADGSDRIVASWTANASAWTRAVRAGMLASRRLVTDRAITDAVLAAAPRRLLDVGCGEGWLVRALAPHLDLAVGVDSVAELVERARTSDPHGQYHLLAYADLSPGPLLPPEGFDTVVANFALLDADPALAALLHRLRLCTAPGGRLLVQTLRPAVQEGTYEPGWRTERFAGFGSSEWTPMPWYFRTIGGWIDLVSRDWVLESLREPVHPETGRPASLLLTAVRRG